MAAESSIKRQIEQCIEELRRGELTEASLLRVVETVDAVPKRRQDLLYLQAGNTSLASEVLGMALIQDGRMVDVPDDPSRWPYQTPLDAIRDGWRVIQFPNLALMMDETRTYGLGCEFILERISDENL